MTQFASHQLDGLEPDNLLAFLALLGLLRSIEQVRPEWKCRVSWSVNEPPLRPILRTPQNVDKEAVVETTVEGLSILSFYHQFGGRKDMAFSREEASGSLQEVIDSSGQNDYVTDLWAALFSDAVLSRDGSKVTPTPLCLMFGQGHQYFLERLASVPKQISPPARGIGRQKKKIPESECIEEALFASWKRPDATQSFRWDPNEDVRYANRARNPTDAKSKETTQHGANRLAAIGFSVMTVVPTFSGNEAKLSMIGCSRKRDGTYVFRWPIWKYPISLSCIRALLVHPSLAKSQKLADFGIVEVNRADRISNGKFMNVTRAVPEFAKSA